MHTSACPTVTIFRETFPLPFGPINITYVIHPLPRAHGWRQSEVTAADGKRGSGAISLSGVDVDQTLTVDFVAEIAARKLCAWEREKLKKSPRACIQFSLMIHVLFCNDNFSMNYFSSANFDIPGANWYVTGVFQFLIQNIEFTY